MESIWQKTVQFKRRDVLPGDLSAEAAVIGAGMAGILTASLLEECGIHTVVLEADAVGSGQTQNTTAKITAQHGLIYRRLIRDFGAERARLFAGANLKAIDAYRQIIRLRGIQCHFENLPSYLYTTMSDASFLVDETKAAAGLGIDASFTHRTTLPFPVSGAVKFQGQAQFHPLEFLKALSEDLEIYERTPALAVKDHHIHTARGTVRAKYIIFATHYPFLNRPGYYFMRMHQKRSYVLALEQAGVMDGMYYSDDPDGLSFRSSGSALLLGGSGHRTGKNSSGGKYARLEQAAGEYYPDSPVSTRWSAQDCMTLDGLPYIGRFSHKFPDMYVATGFGKWGMTNSMISALLIRDLITEVPNPHAALFSPQRHTLAASFKTFCYDGLESGVNLSKSLFYRPGKGPESLGRGQGGLIRYQGKKAGAYRDEEGRLFLVSPRCPHLGCQLCWNPDEKSWDCPCHGSRFDYMGRLIDNPAQTDITRSEEERSIRL